MTELIDRQAALKKLCETCGYCERLENAVHSTHPDFVSDKCNMYKFLAEQPTIEAEPVRHGRWIQSDALDYKDPNGVIHVHGMCSCCRLIYDFRDMTSRFKFCPNCGARMDGGGLSNAHQSKQNPND